MNEVDDECVEEKTLVQRWVINKRGHRSGDGVKDQYHHQFRSCSSFSPLIVHMFKIVNRRPECYNMREQEQKDVLSSFEMGG